ncbi:MAG: polyphosphate polymerase domain-containing protein [Bacilli bacterium]|nr:polyphosphate polymerase domain-containing protein [Bacilli bacterium]
MKKYRNEWKYECNDMQLALLNSKLKVVLENDIHSNSKDMYVVHSLYFDDYKDICAKTTESGDSHRFKWRIRYYNDDIETLRLEYKEKQSGRGAKKICPLTKDEYDDIISGNVETLIWKTKNNLLKRFCSDIMTRYFTPKVIIDYERIAYVETITNIRVTFDKNISSSYEIDKFLTRDYTNYPLQESGMHIVEVKFDDILPGYLKNILNVECGNRISFSKYYNGRKKIEEVVR